MSPDTNSQELSIGQELQLDRPPSTAAFSSSSPSRPQEREEGVVETHLSTDLIEESHEILYPSRILKWLLLDVSFNGTSLFSRKG
ncbi:hypothetical protein EOD39_0296 [Acipenser ruthenus]|uniref:Uncharacterized protein n=1 Tax=Acipenser ruthenus TaxID=7906 RepID=A0A444UBL0_ACIRT|nr:hypothetical protein EOD39_0296 [Acipenser ruthenus]